MHRCTTWQHRETPSWCKCDILQALHTLCQRVFKLLEYFNIRYCFNHLVLKISPRWPDDAWTSTYYAAIHMVISQTVCYTQNCICSGNKLWMRVFLFKSFGLRINEPVSRGLIFKFPSSVFLVLFSFLVLSLLSLATRYIDVDELPLSLPIQRFRFKGVDATIVWRGIVYSQMEINPGGVVSSFIIVRKNGLAISAIWNINHKSFHLKDLVWKKKTFGSTW